MLGFYLSEGEIPFFGDLNEIISNLTAEKAPRSACYTAAKDILAVLTAIGIYQGSGEMGYFILITDDYLDQVRSSQ